MNRLIRLILNKEYSDSVLNWYRFESRYLGNDGWTLMHFRKLYKQRRSLLIKDEFKKIKLNLACPLF